MWLLKPLVLLQVLIGVSMAATDFLQPNISDAQVAKRWFTVPDSQHSVPGEARSWPPRGNMEGLHTISYCFEDDAAYRIMSDLLHDALAKWEPALQVSSLAFAPDTACTGGTQSPCLCSTNGVNEVTVHLRLGVHGAHATPGYWDPFLERGDPNKPRHYIEWPAIQRDTRAKAVLDLAHELAHIVGFTHEHQRGDANQYVRFYCYAIDGYEDAKAHVDSIKTGEQAFTPGMTAEEKMGKVCGDYDLAHKYFPPASPYIQNPYMVGRWQKSGEFDYDSITIYPSSNSKTGDPNPKFILTTIGGDLIYTGGHPDPELAGLSRLDIERVAALYPIKHVDPQSIQKKPPRKRSSDANADAQIAKRWLSLPTSQEPRQPSKFGLWPTCGGVHIVTYCFENENTYNLVSVLFLEALAKWTPAIVRSSLGFAPDSACTGGLETPCLCSVGMDEVTVHIMLSPDHTFRSTFGYLDPLVRRSDLHKPRHYITVSSDEKYTPAFAVLLIAHHLGHVVGLVNEHQRGDAPNYVRFSCMALNGYEDAKTVVSRVTNEPLFAAAQNDDEKMDLICKNFELASKYFAQATQFMPHPTQIINKLRASKEFDYKSIMIYGSHMGKRTGLEFFPLVTSNYLPIFMGGSRNPQNGGLSELDIERIAALYPENLVNPHPIVGGPNGKRSANASALPAKQPTLEVIFPGVLTTIVKPVPVPTDLPKLNNGTSADKLPNPCGGECPGDMDVR